MEIDDKIPCINLYTPHNLTPNGLFSWNYIFSLMRMIIFIVASLWSSIYSVSIVNYGQVAEQAKVESRQDSGNAV